MSKQGHLAALLTLSINSLFSDSDSENNEKEVTNLYMIVTKID